MAAPSPLPSNALPEPPGAVHETTPLTVVPPADGTVPAPDGLGDRDPIADPGGDLAWWAEGLLKAVVAADISDDGEPVLAAAGNAATAALLLVQYHQQHDGDLRETYDVSADQLAIVRELLHTAAGPAVAAPQLPAAPVPAPRQSRATAHRSSGGRQRMRRLRLVRSFAR
jgi:hypothetical protein